MEYRVLGKLEAVRDGEPVDLGPRRQRSLLALLLTDPNTVWSTDRIIDSLWSDDVGSDRQNTLWVYVSGIRTALEPEREKRTEGTILLTRPPGYLLDVDPEDIDAARFERLTIEGRALAATDPAAASLVLGEALALWRGHAYEEFAYESFTQTEIARLEELRLEAVSARIDADLLRGLSRELVSELETLVRQHPMREELTGQLMLALYRSGRQAEALRAYQLLASRLGDELGIEPSTRLRRLEEQVVTGDAALDHRGAPAPAAVAEPGLAVRGYELREQIGEGAFGVVYRAYQPAVGREVAIKVIRPELADDPRFIRRFEAEAQLVARLEHPHIVPLYDYWREPGAAYLVMRLMRGGSLAGVLAERSLTGEQANELVGQVGSALQTAHRAGVVHRDIKPANILLDDDGNTYLSDFGIAVGDDGGPSDDLDRTSSLGPPFASPEQLRRGPIAPSSDIYSLGVVVAQALTGRTGDIDQIRGGLLPAVSRVIDRATAADAELRYPEVQAFAADLRFALSAGAAPTTPSVAPPIELENPYKGLRSFETADATDFHGRERLVDQLLVHLGAPGVRGRFVAVVGPSGSGKSSLVKAGLLPALRRRAIPRSDRWFTVEMTPAPHPFESLEDALLGVAVDPPASLLEQLLAPNGLHLALQRLLPTDGSQLLLVVDQFEELFTQVADGVATQFLDSLVDAISDEHSRIRVIVTLRADFYDRPLRHRGLGELLHEGTQLVTPLTPEELERAITAPVEPLGVTFEPALVAELVHDVVDRAGALPLLQYTLTELFDDRQGLSITEAAYRRLGGVSGALAQRAEVLLGGLGDDAYDVARQVLLRLVTLGEGADDTRRRVLRSELEQLAVDPALLQAVLDTFGRHRLLSFDRDPVSRGPTVEISHEALLTEWTRLRDWIDGARQDVRSQRRLAEAMAEWTTAGEADEYLLRGGRLAQLHGWASTTQLPLSEPEQAFLDASVAERERVSEAERERELRAATAERRARRRVRQLVALGLVAALIAVAAGFGIWQWRRAHDANADFEALATSGRLVSTSQSLLGSDPELALLLAVEAVRSTVDLGFATEEAVDAVHFALHQLRIPYDVATDATTALRPGPRGLTGVYALTPAELVEFAETSVDRELTDDECEEHLESACSGAAVPPDLPLRFGDDLYRGSTALPGAVGAPNRGTIVTVANWGGSIGFLEDVQGFENRSGINVRLASDRTERDLVGLAAQGVVLPDVVFLSDLVAFSDAADRIRPIALDRFLDVERLATSFAEHLLELGTIDGAVTAIPISIDPGGVIFYPRTAFERAGYRLPATWAETVALASQMIDDGETPWCLAFGSEGLTDGWPGAQILESLLIRSAGPDLYEAWTRHEIPFDDPAVLAAGELLGQMLHEDGSVSSPSEVTTNDYDGEFVRLLSRDPITEEIDPECWLFPLEAFALGSVPPTSIGTDLDYFTFPPVDATFGDVANGSATFAIALNDRPEVREFMEFLASSQWGLGQASIDAGFVSPHRGFTIGVYGRNLPPPAHDVLVRLGTEVRDALVADRWRFGAHDRMPPEIGSYTVSGGRGELFSGMLDLALGHRTIEQVLADVEAAWVALEAEP